MKLNKIYSKTFLRTLFIKQNHWHRHSVLGHTFKVVFYAIKTKQYKFIAPALFHDIGKPFVASQESPKDIARDTYSFTNHEEMSWYIVKNWPFLSNWTKDIIRYHYLIRDIYLAKEKGKTARYNRIIKRWKKLSPELKKDLDAFLLLDDAGK